VATAAFGAALVPVLASTSSSDRAATVTVMCRNDSADGEALQSAIDASRPGDEIVIHGPCLVDRTISLAGDRSYRGAGVGTTLTAAPGSDLQAVLASDSWVDDSAGTGLPVTVRDLTVDANGGAQNASGGDGIVLRSWRTTLENVTIRAARGNGLRVTSLSKGGVRLSGTQVNGTLRNLFVTGSGQNGIYVEDPGNAVTDWTLTDSWIASSGTNGIRSENAAGWTVRGNHVYGNGQAGMRLDHLFGTSVTENYVEDFTTEAIRVTVQGDAASVISGNRLFQFRGGGGTFLHVAGVKYGSGQLVISGNAIRGAGTGTGMLFERGTNQLTVVSTGNAVSDVQVPRQSEPGVVVSRAD
jgi:hypothetical protein